VISIIDKVNECHIIIFGKSTLFVIPKVGQPVYIQ